MSQTTGGVVMHKKRRSQCGIASFIVQAFPRYSRSELGTSARFHRNPNGLQIMGGRSYHGGWEKKQLELLGIQWPPASGQMRFVRPDR